MKRDRNLEKALENIDFVLLRQALDSLLDLTDQLPPDLDENAVEFAPQLKSSSVRGFFSLADKPLASLEYACEVLSSLTVAAAKDGLPSDVELACRLERAKR